MNIDQIESSVVVVIFRGDDHQPTTCGVPGGTERDKKKREEETVCI